jgi:hypothetical protein
MSSSCVPIVMYLNKMSNVLQTHPHMFVHVPKLKFSIRNIPQNWIFFGTCPKTKICANVKTTLLICIQLYEIMHKFLLIFYLEPNLTKSSKSNPSDALYLR